MAELTEEQTRIRGYLQSQAAKLSLPALMDKVRTDSAQLRDVAALAADVDQERRPAVDDWSVNEVMNHLHDSCRRVNASMLSAAFDGAQPGAIPDSLGGALAVRPATEWFDLIASEREATFERMSALDGSENLGITWNHPFFGDLNWREWLLFLRLHDMDHARQLQGIIAALQAR